LDSRCTIENCLVCNRGLILLCTAVFFNVLVVPKQKICEYFIDANITEAQIMGLGTRIFILKEDDSLRRLSLKRYS
jgi:hypothetical protein